MTFWFLKNVAVKEENPNVEQMALKRSVFLQSKRLLSTKKQLQLILVILTFENGAWGFARGQWKGCELKGGNSISDCLNSPLFTTSQQTPIFRLKQIFEASVEIWNYEKATKELFRKSETSHSQHLDISSLTILLRDQRIYITTQASYQFDWTKVERWHHNIRINSLNEGGKRISRKSLPPRKLLLSTTASKMKHHREVA